MAAPTVEELLRAAIGLDPATLGPGLIDRAVPRTPQCPRTDRERTALLTSKISTSLNFIP